MVKIKREKIEEKKSKSISSSKTSSSSSIPNIHKNRGNTTGTSGQTTSTSQPHSSGSSTTPGTYSPGPGTTSSASTPTSTSAGSSPTTNTPTKQETPQNTNQQNPDKTNDNQKNPTEDQAPEKKPEKEDKPADTAPKKDSFEKPKPKPENIESKKKPTPDKSKSGSPDQMPGMDKLKAAKDPKQFAKDQAINMAREAAKNAAKKAATAAATKALGATIGSAIGGPLGTVAGLIAGELAGLGIELTEKAIKIIIMIAGILLLFFATLIFLIIMAIANFFMTGGDASGVKVDDEVKKQATPVNAPSYNIPIGAKSLEKPREWLQFQAIPTGCHCTAVAMYLTFLGFPNVNENSICYINGDNLKDSVNFADVEATYPVSRAGQIMDTDSFDTYKKFIIDNIDNGKPVLIGVGPNIARGNSHFLIVVGYDQNNIYTNDPNENNPSSQTWNTLENANISKNLGGLKYHGYTISLTN